LENTEVPDAFSGVVDVQDLDVGVGMDAPSTAKNAACDGSPGTSQFLARGRPGES